MRHFHVHAKDGEVGRVDEFYLDDHSWTVRYVSVDVGHWFNRKKVLVPAGKLDHTVDNRLLIDKTRQDMSRSPDIESVGHISRSQEIELLDHYNAPYYWNRPQYTPPRVYNPNTGLDFTGQKYPVSENPSKGYNLDADVARRSAHHDVPNTTVESHLRESEELIGYRVHAADGDIGHIHDMGLDDAGWVVRYLIVDIGSWLNGKRILIAPQWMESRGWEDRRVYTFFDKETIRNAPEFDNNFPVKREYEDLLFTHYNQPGYWE